MVLMKEVKGRAVGFSDGATSFGFKKFFRLMEGGPATEEEEEASAGGVACGFSMPGGSPWG
jgi:hypothetical protein